MLPVRRLPLAIDNTIMKKIAIAQQATTHISSTTSPHRMREIFESESFRGASFQYRATPPVTPIPPVLNSLA